MTQPMARGLRGLVLVLAALLPTVLGCGSPKKAEKPEEEHLPRLETEQAERGMLPIKIELSAVIEPMEKADLCGRVPGVIESLQLDPHKPEVDIGRPITAGEPLVKVAVPDLEAEKQYKDALLDQARKQRDQVIEAQKVAATELQEAREQERRYQAEFYRSDEKHNRTVKLVQGGSISRELAEETRNQLEAARSAWQAARAAIATKEARLAATAADLKLAESRIVAADAEVKRLTVLVDYATIRAPFDGIVTRRYLDRGAMVKDTATPILAVMRTDMVRVLLDIPQKNVPLIHATYQNPNPDGQGDAVQLWFPELKDEKVAPDGKFLGHITRVASALDSVTRTMRAEVHLENKTVTKNGHVVRLLRPGMCGTALVLLEDGRYVLTVPSTALVRRGNSVYVYHVAEASGQPLKGVVRSAEVELGLDDGRRVEIRKGLRGDELIIVKGNGVLRDGDKVIAVERRKL
jgi:RND family efflux transporter MFP subunit